MSGTTKGSGTSQKISVSACLVVYHEEALIERCLKSIRPLCNEIIVIHDGKCNDRTLALAAELDAVVIEQPRIGIAEPHRVTSFEMARGEWVLQIDADEFLTEEALESLKDVLCNPGKCNGFLLIWPIWNGTKYVTSQWPRRPCLFRRSAMHFVGFPQSEVTVDGGVKPIPVRLEHQPLYNNYDLSTYMRKKRKWVAIHEKYLLKEIENCPAFNAPKHRRWPFHMEVIRRCGRIAIPINAAVLFLGALKSGGWREPRGLFLSYWQSLLYYSDLSVQYAKAKRDGAI